MKESLLEVLPSLVYAGAVGNNGYFPTHHKKFCQRLTGDCDIDMANNRTKWIFNGGPARCGVSAKLFLLQTYKRNTGEVMRELLMSIDAAGRHWGRYHVGYRLIVSTREE